MRLHGAHTQVVLALALVTVVFTPLRAAFLSPPPSAVVHVFTEKLESLMFREGTIQCFSVIPDPGRVGLGSWRKEGFVGFLALFFSASSPERFLSSAMAVRPGITTVTPL